MFDIGFSELMVIGIVALLVLGPERLPKVARTTGHLLGRLQRYVSDVKSDINREMQLDELKKLQEEARKSAMAFEGTVRSEMAGVESGLSSSLQSASSAIGDLENTLKSTPPASPELVDTGHSHDVVSDLLDKQLAEAEQHAGPPVFVDVPPTVAPAVPVPASPASTEPGAAGKSTPS